jgi:hypothetical protein
MRNDYTHISVVQDKSGSMSGLRKETIGGFNTFLGEQQKAPGKCTMTLLQFDTSFNLLADGEDIHGVEALTESTYQPGGNTALLDAIARTITTTGQQLSAMSEPERPARVIVLIMTDGEENSSREFGGQQGHARVMAMIKEQTEKWKWQFIFMGANQDAIKAGESLGMSANNVMSYAATAKGTSHAFAAASSNVRSYRSAAPDQVDHLAFSEEQRDEQYAEGAHDKLKADATKDPKKATT